MIRRTGLILSLSCILCAFTISVQAQNYVYNTYTKPAADKIVAIIGDKIILESDVQNMLMREKQQYGNLPPEAACMILEQMIDNNVLTLQAEKDSLPVSDDQVEGVLEQKIRHFIGLYGSEQKMQEVTGKSIYQIKEEFRKPIKDQLLAQAEQEKIVNAVKITPTEVQAYFNNIPKDSLPFFKSEVEVGQIVINPKPSPDVVKYIIDQLKDLRKEALSGKRSFATLANLYSKDVASGGRILTIDRTQHMFDPQFVAAAFRLKNGEISPVFKSQFGYHIIQMVSREGNIAKVRHILLIPPTTSIDINKAKRKLDSVRADIIAGKFTFGQASSKYNDDDTYPTGTKRTGGMFTMPDGSSYMPINDLDPGIVLLIDSMKVGTISQPVEYTPNEHMPDQKSVRIVYLKSRSKPHQENLQEDYSRVQAKALQQKQYKALNEWFNKHIPDFYLKIDSEYTKCADINNWVKNSRVKGD